MPSASSIWSLCAASLLLLAVVLAGCDTTQDKAARLKVRSTRSWPAASRRDRSAGATATCGSSGRRSSAVRARPRSPSRSGTSAARRSTTCRWGGRPMADGKPLTSRGRRSPTSRPTPRRWPRASAPPGCSPRTTTSDRVDSAFARWAPRATRRRPPASVPALDVSAVGAVRKDPEQGRGDRREHDRGRAVRPGRIRLGPRHGRYVAAGRTDVEELDPDERRPSRSLMTGKAKGASLHVAAPPTIFQ